MSRMKTNCVHFAFEWHVKSAVGYVTCAPFSFIAQAPGQAGSLSHVA